MPLKLPIRPSCYIAVLQVTFQPALSATERHGKERRLLLFDSNVVYREGKR